MLVLTRRAGESIVIGDDVRVVVLDVRGDTIRLGIEAPRSVQVHRAEVYVEVQAANAAAAAPDGDLDAAAERLRLLARPASQRPAPAQRLAVPARGRRTGEARDSVPARPAQHPHASEAPKPGPPKPGPPKPGPPKPRPPGPHP